MIGSIIRFIFGKNAWPKKRGQTQATRPPSVTHKPPPTPTWQDRAAAAGALVDPKDKQPQNEIKTITISIGSPLQNTSKHTNRKATPDFNEMLKKQSLAKAAQAKSKALASEKEGDYDKAWKYFHEQKKYYLEHASDAMFSPEDVLSLDAAVSESLANILRKQKKHNEAFVHIAYWVSAQHHKPLKRHADKFRAYYNRADEMSVSLEGAWNILTTAPPLMDYRQTQLIVNQWLKK